MSFSRRAIRVAVACADGTAKCYNLLGLQGDYATFVAQLSSAAAQADRAVDNPRSSPHCGRSKEFCVARGAYIDVDDESVDNARAAFTWQLTI